MYVKVLACKQSRSLKMARSVERAVTKPLCFDRALFSTEEPAGRLVKSFLLLIVHNQPVLALEFAIILNCLVALNSLLS